MGVGDASVGVKLPAGGDAFCLMSSGMPSEAPVACSVALNGFSDFGERVVVPVKSFKEELMRGSSGDTWFGRKRIFWELYERDKCRPVII